VGARRSVAAFALYIDRFLRCRQLWRALATLRRLDCEMLFGAGLHSG
jgi:hypothetical protein